MASCPSCASDVPDGSRFCGSCGAAIEASTSAAGRRPFGVAHRSIAGIGSALLLFSLTACSAPDGTEGREPETGRYKPPPVIVTFEDFSRWTAEAAARIHPGMEIRIVGTDEWAGYINQLPDAPVKHFIDKACDGLQPGENYDFNYVEDKDKRVRLGSAEITEDGIFYFWWQRCNFYDISPEVCRDELIPVFVFHEGVHWRQRNRLVEQAIHDVLGESAPEHGRSLTLAEIEALPKGKEIRERFMAEWTSCDHYRCREIEAYMAEIEQGYTPDWEVPDLLPVIGEDVARCRDSAAAGDFGTDLRQAEAFLAKHGYGPASGVTRPPQVP